MYYLLENNEIVNDRITTIDTKYITNLARPTASGIHLIYDEQQTLIIKQSENILDLVALGDLVEVTKDMPLPIVNSRDISKIKKSKKIIYLYKKQSNGDFKRYEVKNDENN